jgi:predicted nuclease with RNAse H fold
MMRTLGIDLAAEPAGTAAFEITWGEGTARGVLHGAGLDDGRLLELIGAADKVGIDCPFGWPRPFVEAVVAHGDGAVWPGRGQPGAGFRRSLRYRLTDEVVWRRVGWWPLSVSTDLIGVPAMRCAGLLDALAQSGEPVDRAGGGRVVEVYPAAALHHWGLPHRGYKRPKGAAVRSTVLDRLLAMLPWLVVDQAALERCRGDDDAFDALVCALVARAAGLGHTTRPDPGDQAERAGSEGWIHLPTGEVSRLLGPA